MFDRLSAKKGEKNETKGFSSHRKWSQIEVHAKKRREKKLEM